MRGFYDFLRSRIHKEIGFERTIATKTIRVYSEDVSGNITHATGTDAASTQDSIAGYAKGAVYIKTNVAGATDGRYINIGTTSSSSFALEATAVTAGSITTTELANDAVTSAKLAETTIKYATVTLTATEIVGTTAGDIGATAGAELVAAPGAGKVIEFISAALIYDYDTAAYTGGGNDLVVRHDATAVSAVVTSANLLGAAVDKIVVADKLSAASIVLVENKNLNLFSTAWTQPGTAAGALRVKVAYRIHTTGL